MASGAFQWQCGIAYPAVVLKWLSEMFQVACASSGTSNSCSCAHPLFSLLFAFSDVTRDCICSQCSCYLRLPCWWVCCKDVVIWLVTCSRRIALLTHLTQQTIDLSISEFVCSICKKLGVIRCYGGSVVACCCEARGREFDIRLRFSGMWSVKKLCMLSCAH